jgi:hypothetical protein
MKLNHSLLVRLSKKYVHDLRRSTYYKELTPAERAALEERLIVDAQDGSLPLLPGALEDDLDWFQDCAEAELGVTLPPSWLEILQEIDGFVENGVTFYAIDPWLYGDDDESTAGIIAETRAFWASYPNSDGRFVLLADSDLFYYAFEITGSKFVALSRTTLELVHQFESAADLANDLLRQALGDWSEEQEPASDVRPTLTDGN